MAGFFEKKIMAEILSLLKAAWPAIDAAVFDSPYNDDGLIVKVRMNASIAFDLTIFHARWTSIPRVTKEGVSLPADLTSAYVLPLSVGAPPKKVAPVFYEFLRQMSDGSQEFHATLTESSSE